MQITDWIFDLDGTLYTPLEHVWKITLLHMRRYFIETLGLPITLSLEEQELIKAKWQTTQTTVAYCNEFQLDFDALVSATHLPILNHIVVTPRLGTETIQHLPGKKWVLTNSPELFAHAMLRHINLDIFDEVFGIRHDQQCAKPNPKSFQRVPVGSHVVMIDDWHENLIIPFNLGWTTVWFPEINHPGPIELPSYVNLKITSLSQLTSLL